MHGIMVMHTRELTTSTLADTMHSRSDHLIDLLQVKCNMCKLQNVLDMVANA